MSFVHCRAEIAALMLFAGMSSVPGAQGSSRTDVAPEAFAGNRYTRECGRALNSLKSRRFSERHLDLDNVHLRRALDHYRTAIDPDFDASTADATERRYVRNNVTSGVRVHFVDGGRFNFYYFDSMDHLIFMFSTDHQHRFRQWLCEEIRPAVPTGQATGYSPDLTDGA